MQTHTKSIRLGSDLNADVYSRYEQTQNNIAFFEGKNGKQKVHNFLSGEETKRICKCGMELPSVRACNNSNLALWAWGQIVLQNRNHEKAKRLAGVISN